METLNRRSLPSWFDDAKFGIFIHWGLFSIPAFAPRLGNISDVFKSDYDRAVCLTPYTEWYANAIKVPDSPSAEFHRSHYPDLDYPDFRDPFLKGLEQWDPDDWAELFKTAGARYVVLVSKHHDGYCLWPSQIRNPNRPDWTSQRDIVGELARAVRSRGLRFGLYYSGGIDWSFNTRPLKTFGDFISSAPGGNYPEYAARQLRELIERYQPSILWNDISWPDHLASLRELFDFYYQRVPDGVVNDRWRHTTLSGKALKLWPVRRAFDYLAKRHIRKHPNSANGVITQPIPHSDFRTSEYAAFGDIQVKKWEATRGMSNSFGFNRNDTEQDYESAGSLLSGLIDAVSKNGNLLLNVGPRGVDASIPTEQRSRLEQMGSWLAINGEAIYGTQPWNLAAGTTEEGIEVRYTQNEGKVYAIFLGTPKGKTLRVLDFPVQAGSEFHVSQLAGSQPVMGEVKDNSLILQFQQPLPEALAHVVAIMGLADKSNT